VRGRITHAGISPWLACREFYPDTAAPQQLQEASQGVDFGLTFYYVGNQTMMEPRNHLLWDGLRVPANAALVDWVGTLPGEALAAPWRSPRGRACCAGGSRPSRPLLQSSCCCCCRGSAAGGWRAGVERVMGGK
jgi:hypothetical protein